MSPAEVRRNQEPVHEPSARGLVVHFIMSDHHRIPARPLAGLEAAFMDPAPVGDSCVFVHKAMRRLPRGDLATPPEG